MRTFFAILSCLLLAACDDDLTSEIPEIAQEDLAAPDEMAGEYWTLDFDGNNLSAWQGNWSWGEDKQGIVTGQDGEMRVRLVDLIDSDVRLLITENDIDKDISTYFVMYPVESGILRVDHIDVPYNDFTTEAAERHGFTFGSSRDKLKALSEEFPGEAIPALFRDPDFLGTLTFTPASYFLPVGKPAVAPEGSAAKLPLRVTGPFSLTLDGDVTPGVSGGWQAPEALSGRFRTSDDEDVEGWSRLFMKRQITFEHQSDGTILLLEPDGTGQEAPFARISVVSFPLNEFLKLEDRADGSLDVTFNGHSIDPGESFAVTFMLDGEEMELKYREDSSFALHDQSGDEPRAIDRGELNSVLTRGVMREYFGTYQMITEVEVEQDGQDYLQREPRLIMLDTFPGQDCWFLTTFVPKPASGSAKLNALRLSLMKEAARSHGLDFEYHPITGAKSLTDVMGLIMDERFSHGIEATGVTQFCASSAS